MSWLPPELQLRRGAIFRLMHQYRAEGEKYRFFIVLNHDPQSDRLIILTTTTTQLHRLEREYGAGDDAPLVYIHHSDYPDIERFCVVDCRALDKWEKNDLITALKMREHAFLTPLPDHLLEKIVEKIAGDKTIPSSIKCLVVKPEQFQ